MFAVNYFHSANLFSVTIALRAILKQDIVLAVHHQNVIVRIDEQNL